MDIRVSKNEYSNLHANNKHIYAYSDNMLIALCSFAVWTTAIA